MPRLTAPATLYLDQFCGARAVTTSHESAFSNKFALRFQGRWWDARGAGHLGGQHSDPVDVAPGPLFIGLKRADDRVAGRVRVCGGVAVRRLVTAADVPAFEADPQVEPLLAGGQAILAPIDPFRQLDDPQVIAVAAEGHASRGSSYRPAPS